MWNSLMQPENFYNRENNEKNSKQRLQVANSMNKIIRE